MSNIETGGPAFPSHGSMGEVAHEGMTLRDYFAAKASEEDIAEFLPKTVGESIRYPHRTRQWARYKHADRMLKARSQS
jgi:hypothetical protein